MDKLQAMTIFVQVAEHQSFAAAGRRLGLSAPAITRAVAALEDRLGVRLLTRTTRRVRLTEAGQRYHEDCRRILADIEEADGTAAGLHGALRGAISITASQLFGRLFVMPLVLRFLDQHPDLTARTVFVDRIVSLMEEGIDVAIRIAELPNSGLHARRVGSVRRIVCASPAYLARHGTPQTPGDLRSHTIIAPTILSQSVGEWRFQAAGKPLSVPVSPRLTTTSNDTAIDAAVGGWGLTRLLSYQVATELAEGRLQIVLADYELPPLPIHIVHAEGRRMSAKLRAFIDFAARELRRDPLIGVAPPPPPHEPAEG